jgi:hypothetical protein
MFPYRVERFALGMQAAQSDEDRKEALLQFLTAQLDPPTPKSKGATDEEDEALFVMEGPEDAKHHRAE